MFERHVQNLYEYNSKGVTENKLGPEFRGDRQ